VSNVAADARSTRCSFSTPIATQRRKTTVLGGGGWAGSRVAVRTVPHAKKETEINKNMCSSIVSWGGLSARPKTGRNSPDGAAEERVVLNGNAVPGPAADDDADEGADDVRGVSASRKRTLTRSRGRITSVAAVPAPKPATARSCGQGNALPSRLMNCESHILYR